MMGLGNNNGGVNFNQQSPVFNAFGGFQNCMQQFQNFMGSMRGMNQQQMAAYAQQQIQQKLQSGEVSQEQFNNVAAMANQMLGGNIQR